MEPLPRVFEVLQYFETIFLWWKAFDLLNKKRYTLWVVALLEACDVTNGGCHLDRHLGFYKEVEIRLKTREMVIFCALPYVAQYPDGTSIRTLKTNTQFLRRPLQLSVNEVFRIKAEHFSFKMKVLAS